LEIPTSRSVRLSRRSWRLSHRGFAIRKAFSFSRQYLFVCCLYSLLLVDREQQVPQLNCYYSRAREEEPVCTLMMFSHQSGGVGGTGYAGDGNDKKKRAAGRKEAQAKEAQDADSQCRTLRQALQSPLTPPTESPHLILLRQVLRNFGIPAIEKKAKHTQLMDLTLQVVENILQRHPKCVGNLYSRDDSLLLALQEASMKSQMIKNHPEGGYSKKELDQAEQVVALFPRARTASAHTYEAPDIMVTDSQDNYRRALRPHAFALCEELKYHHFRRSSAQPGATAGFSPSLIRRLVSNGTHNTSSNTMSGPQRKRLFQELSNYHTNLPIESGSSILVRAMEGSMDYLRVLIFGPEDTPYANGCFFFDLFLQDYPKKPPKCQFLTTGGGKYRFNPNLYECGKVCLSLLGTWQGPGWQPNESTLYQLLISIQSLILGESDPYFNEPGFAAQKNTPRGTAESQKYNQRIQSYTCAAAILPFLLSSSSSSSSSSKGVSLSSPSPYPEFQDAIDLHFRLKQTQLISQLQRWAQEEPNNKSTTAAVQQCLNILVSRTLLVDHSDVMVVSGPSSSTDVRRLATTPPPKRRRRLTSSLLATSESSSSHKPTATPKTGTSNSPVVISIDLDDDEETDMQQAIRASTASKRGSRGSTDEEKKGNERNTEEEDQKLSSQAAKPKQDDDAEDELGQAMQAFINAGAKITSSNTAPVQASPARARGRKPPPPAEEVIVLDSSDEDE
jgi:ubiquitin-protein ligase